MFQAARSLTPIVSGVNAGALNGEDVIPATVRVLGLILAM